MSSWSRYSAQLHAKDSGNRETLLNLRLASKVFAVMGNITSCLFKKVSLSDQEEHLERLENMDISKIAPFVSFVVFHPALYTSSLKLKHFIEICDSEQIDWDTLDEGVRRTNIEALYEDSYLTRARNLESRKHVRRLRTVWESALSQFSNGHHFVFLPLGRDVYEKVLGPDIGLRAREKPFEHSYNLIRTASMEPETNLLVNAIRCLAKAQSRIHTLFIDWRMVRGLDERAAQPAWQKLDLSNLRSFTFDKANDRWATVAWGGMETAMTQFSRILQLSEGSL